jgi:hypothetical protein
VLPAGFLGFSALAFAQNAQPRNLILPCVANAGIPPPTDCAMQ